MNVIELHKANEYFIDCKKLDSVNGCIITYPEKKIGGKFEKEKYLYFVKDGAISVHIAGQNKDFECPNYAQRILVQIDAILKAQKRGMSEQLILCTDMDNNVFGGYKEIRSLLQLFDSSSVEQEQTLIDFVRSVSNIKNVISEAKNLGILDGFNACKKLTNAGGFKI